MSSRAILILTLFSLACLVTTGSLVLQLSSAHAGTEPADEAEASSPFDNLSILPEKDGTTGTELRDAGAETAAATSSEVGAEDLVIGDSLEVLLRRVHVMFEPDGSGVSNSMIPYLADMITLMNQHDHLIYRVEIVEPDASLARRRAQTLNDVLRLNILEPSKLRILGREGSHAARVTVSAS